MSAACELRAAHTIIRNALAVMTTAQKVQWSELNERDGAHGEGVTRANERGAALAAAGDLAHELRTVSAQALNDAAVMRAQGSVLKMPPDVADRLADLLTRAADALAAPNTPKKEA